MAPFEQVTVPAQERLRAYQEEQVLQLVHREVVEQAGEDCSVSVGERGLADLALKDEQLVTEGKDLDVFVPVTHRQQAQQGEALVAAR